MTLPKKLVTEGIDTAPKGRVFTDLYQHNKWLFHQYEQRPLRQVGSEYHPERLHFIIADLTTPSIYSEASQQPNSSTVSVTLVALPLHCFIYPAACSLPR